MKFIRRYLLAGILLAVLSAACQATPAPIVQETAVESVIPTVVASPANLPAPEGETTSTPRSVAPTPAGEEPRALPTVRTALEATDPTTVSLTSGQPTLVEFFAFW